MSSLIITPDVSFKNLLIVGNDSVTAQKHIARDLTNIFPNTELWVYEEDGIVTVDWEDAESCKEVSAVIDKYNLLDYKGTSDRLTRKTDTTFNKTHGGCYLVLRRLTTGLKITGRKVIKGMEIIEGTRSPDLIKGTGANTAFKNIVLELKERFPTAAFGFDYFQHPNALRKNKIEDYVFVIINHSFCSMGDASEWMNRIGSMISKYKLRYRNKEFNDMHGGVDHINVSVGYGGMKGEELNNFLNRL